MKFSELNSGRLKSLIYSAEFKVESQVKHIKIIEEQIKKLSRDKLEAEQKMGDWSFRAKLLREALLLNAGIPKEVADLRQQLLNLMQESMRGDITIDRYNWVKQEIDLLKSELMEKCTHPLVISHCGSINYGGWNQGWDYGIRKCLVCSFIERVVSVGSQSATICLEKWTILAKDEQRIIRHETEKMFNSFNIWRPIDEILEALLDLRVVKMLAEETK